MNLRSIILAAGGAVAVLATASSAEAGNYRQRGYGHHHGGYHHQHYRPHYRHHWRPYSHFAPPPVYYAPMPYAYAPPVVYFGFGVR